MTAWITCSMRPRPTAISTEPLRTPLTPLKCPNEHAKNMTLPAASISLTTEPSPLTH